MKKRAKDSHEYLGIIFTTRSWKRHQLYCIYHELIKEWKILESHHTQPDKERKDSKTANTVHVKNNDFIVPGAPKKEILRIHKNVTICTDILFVDKLIIFTTISIKFNAHNCWRYSKSTPFNIKKVNNLYRRHIVGFQTRQIYTDEDYDKPME